MGTAAFGRGEGEGGAADSRQKGRGERAVQRRQTATATQLTPRPQRNPNPLNRQAWEAHGYSVPREDVEALHRLADVNGDAKLDVAEFIAATLHHSRELEEEENLLFAFKVCVIVCCFGCGCSVCSGVCVLQCAQWCVCGGLVASSRLIRARCC